MSSSKTTQLFRQMMKERQTQRPPKLKRKSIQSTQEVINKKIKKEPDVLDVQDQFIDKTKIEENVVMNKKEMIEIKTNEEEGIDKKINEIEMESTDTSTNSLPKGFFDDPLLDSKARKVIYTNPIDQQWDQFQKEIAEENNVSQNIIEEEMEGTQIDKNLEEIEEQIANWIKVKEIQKKVEILHNHIIKKKESMYIKEEDNDSDVDENDLNVFSNWRSRTAFK